MSSSSITTLSCLETFPAMPIDESDDAKVADSIVPENEANDEVDSRKVQFSFPEIREDIYALTKVHKPTVFVQNSDVLYAPPREGNTTLASSNKSGIQARFDRDREICSFKPHQVDNEFIVGKKERGQGSIADNDGERANRAPELPLKVLCKNSILPGCYIKCYSKSNSKQSIEKTCLEHAKDYPIHAKLLSTVKVSELRFYDHPLFIEEERLCSQLQLTFEKYRRHHEERIVSSLHPRLTTLIPQVISLLTSTYGTDELKNESLQSVFSSLIAELVEVVSLTVNEIYHSQELGSTLWSLWNSLQFCRTRQNFQSTNVKLIFTACSGKDHGSSGDWQTCVQGLTIFLQRLLLDSKEPEDISCAFAKDTSVKLKNHLQNVLIATETLSRSFNKPEISFTLLQEEIEKVTIATTNDKEQERRRQVSSERYYVRLMLDTKCIGCSKAVSLSWPKFSLPIDHIFELSLTKKPRHTAIELVKCALGGITLFDQVVSSIYIGIPNKPCAEIEIRTPNIYQFASHKSYKSIDGHQTRLKGFITVFEDLDDKFSFPEGIKAIAETPELKAQGRFRGLKISQRQCLVSNSGIQRSSCEREIKSINVPDHKSRCLRATNEATNEATNGKCSREKKLCEIVKMGRHFPITCGFFSLVNPLFLPRKRSLRPTYVPRTSWFTKPSIAVAYNLLVTIDSARNVPLRSPHYSEEFLRSPHRASTPIRSTRLPSALGKVAMEPMTFVRVRFQGTSLVTRAVAGRCPIWKKTFTFAIRVLNHESPGAISFVQDALQVDLFDAAEIDFRTFGGYYEDENTLLSENRYIGGLYVSFSRLQLSERTERVIRLQTPVTCIGYDKNYTANQNNKGSSPGNGIETLYDARCDSPSNIFMKRGGPSSADLLGEAESSLYMKLSIAVDPSIQLQEEETSFPINHEETALKNHVQRWFQMLRSHCKAVSKRMLPVFLQDTEGFHWLITRFIRSQNPPYDMDSVYKCAYYVSLIPVQEISQSSKVWLSNKEFLDQHSGSWGQHAMLLASYFIYLSDKYPEDCAADVYLLFGKAYPERETVYVMRSSKLDDDKALWDASKGIAYSLLDDRCPLDHIGAVITFENIYANIQNSGRPCYMSFDLNDKSCWKPFYTRRFPRPSFTNTSFQDSELVYREPDANSSYELQIRLKDFLKESFRQWRRISTCFNGDIGNRLDAILEHLEYDKLHAISSFPQKYKMILESATKGRRIFGLDFHYPFTTLNDVITSVEAAGIHMCRHPDVEFAVGARVFPYCNDLYSIRVFIISIFP